MEMKIEHSPLTTITDERGVLFEPLSAEEIANYKNVHIVISNPGVVRGNHYHRKGKETLAVTGPSVVRYRLNGKNVDVTVPENRVYRFTFPPLVAHAIKNIGSRPNLLIAFNTMEHDQGHPDTVVEELL